MINQVELIGVVLVELDRQGVKSLCSRQLNAVIRHVDGIIAECNRKPVLSSEGMGLTKWLASDDVGLSSAYMASVMGGIDRPYAHPHDIDDFGRCSRLLLAVPEFREKLGMMRDKSREWSALVDVWDKIELLMAEEKYREANNLVRKAVERENAT